MNDQQRLRPATPEREPSVPPPAAAPSPDADPAAPSAGRAASAADSAPGGAGSPDEPAAHDRAAVEPPGSSDPPAFDRGMSCDGDTTTTHGGGAAPATATVTESGSMDGTRSSTAVPSPDESTADRVPPGAAESPGPGREAPDAVVLPPGTAVPPRAEPGTEEADRAEEAEPTERLDVGRLRSAVEAILFVVDRPTTTVELAQVLDVPQPVAAQALAGLRTDLDEQRRGFELREVAGGWRLYTREEFASYVERYVLDGQQARLTQAALETLAVVAYRQPVTRARISAIRGVSVDSVIRTLLARGLIEECGSEPDTGGLLYRTTPLFLEKLGLHSLEELPSLAPLLPELNAVEDVAPST